MKSPDSGSASAQLSNPPSSSPFRLFRRPLLPSLYICLEQVPLDSSGHRRLSLQSCRLSPCSYSSAYRHPDRSHSRAALPHPSILQTPTPDSPSTPQSEDDLPEVVAQILSFQTATPIRFRAANC